LNRSLSGTKQRQESLKTSIKALEQTEQRLVLVKDRLDKAESVISLANTSEEELALQQILSLIPDGVVFLKSSLSTEAIEVEVRAQDSITLSRLLSVLVPGNMLRPIIWNRHWWHYCWAC